MGGLAGHMMHPHDNLKLTIGDFIAIFNKTVKNELPASEKLDGFNIHILNVKGEIRFARNAGDLANGGFGKADIENRFTNERVRDTFRKGFEMAENDKRFKMLPEWDLFHYTMNTEIITGCTNIMPYAEELLVPHNLFRWQLSDDKYVVMAVDEIPGGLKTNLPFTWISAESDYNEVYWQKKIWDTFPIELTIDNTLEEYYGHKFTQVVMAVMEGEYSYELVQAMFKRFFKLDKTNLRELRKVHGSENVQKFLDLEKQLVFLTKDDLDQLVLEMGTYILGHFRGLNWASGLPYQAMQILHSDVLKTVQNAEVDTKIFVHRWMACKGQIFPTEGLVVEFKGDRYKWTGPFAPINQLLGGNR